MSASRSNILWRSKALRNIHPPCLQCSKRPYSSLSPNEILPKSQARSGAVLLTTRRLIELRGPQAPQFLQGLTTANITPWSEDQPRIIYSAFLNAQGRLLQDVFIYPVTNSSAAATNEETFLIDVDANQVSNLLKWLKKYKLRTKVTIREIPADEAGVLCTWPSDPSNDANTRDPRVSGFGTREAGSIQELLNKYKTSLQYSSDADPLSPSMALQYEIRRYMHGIAEGQDELPHEHALIHDSNIDYMDGVDFRKGCYVGQELVIRTQHTGVVRKRILPCVVYDAHEAKREMLVYDGTKATLQVPQGADIKALDNDGKRAKSKGKWLAGVGNVGLALCRLEDMVGVGPAGDVVEGWEDREWGLEWEGQSEGEKGLRAKAFVPEWWRERIKNGKTSGVA